MGEVMLRDYLYSFQDYDYGVIPLNMYCEISSDDERRGMSKH